jgi:hypothetical protein
MFLFKAAKKTNGTDTRSKKANLKPVLRKQANICREILKNITKEVRLCNKGRKVRSLRKRNNRNRTGESSKFV